MEEGVEGALHSYDKLPIMRKELLPLHGCCRILHIDCAVVALIDRTGAMLAEGELSAE